MNDTPATQEVSVTQPDPDQMAADAVAEAAASVGTSWIPALADIPRDDDADAAKRTAALAAGLMVNATRFASIALFVPDIDTVAAVRLRVATVADVVIRRGLSKRAVLDAEAAKRWTERALGVALMGEGFEGRAAVKVAGDDAARYLGYAQVSIEDFRAAIERARAAGTAGPDMVAAAMIPGTDIPAPEPEPEPVAAEPTAVDMDVLMPESIATLAGVAEALGAVRPGDVAAVSPEAAADWATALWKVLVPIMAVRRDLMARGG